MKESIKVDKKLFEKYDDAVNFYQWEKSSKVVNWYNNLMPKWLDYKNMKNVPWKEYSYKHDHLEILMYQFVVQNLMVKM